MNNEIGTRYDRIVDAAIRAYRGRIINALSFLAYAHRRHNLISSNGICHVFQKYLVSHYEISSDVAYALIAMVCEFGEEVNVLVDKITGDIYECRI